MIGSEGLGPGPNIMPITTKRVLLQRNVSYYNQRAFHTCKTMSYYNQGAVFSIKHDADSNKCILKSNVGSIVYTVKSGCRGCNKTHYAQHTASMLCGFIHEHH